MSDGAPPASASSAGSLRRGLTLRLALVLAVALAALSLVVVVVVERAGAAAAQRQLDDAAVFIERRFAGVDRSWRTQADVLRVQIEFSRVFDDPDPASRNARLTAFFAMLGGDSAFSHVLLVAADGAELFRYATSSQQSLPAPPPSAGDAAWIFGAADATLYRSLAQPVLVAGEPARLLLFVPMDRTVLSTNSYPGTEVELHWQGRVLLGRQGGAAGAASQPAGSSERSVGWAGDDRGPRLRVLRTDAAAPLAAVQEFMIAALGGLAVALLGWLVLGRWLARHASRLASLQRASALFTGAQQVTPDVAQALAAARGGDVNEVEQLARQMDAGMRASEHAQHALAELNATLEHRVRDRTRDLELARDEALSATRLKEQFLANMSHELRTPLAGMLGSLELLSAEQLPGDEREMLRIARSSGQALLSLINELLDFAKIEAGRLQLSQEPLDPVELIDDVVHLFAATARAKGVRLRAALDAIPHELRVVGDRQRLRQVLLNLTGNALKFTPEGSVTLRLERLSRAGDAAVRLRFSVEDSGIGVAEGDQERIFRPFVQVGVGQGGTGLGLPISQRLVEAMGGRIVLDSQHGQVTRFHFTLELPLAPVGSARALPVGLAASELPALRGCVLVVDDNPVNRLVASEMLRRLGLEVDEGADGRDAVERVAARHYDLVLMDCLMPVLDGYGATRAIRAQEQASGSSRLPIVALTANALPADVQRCLDAGMDAHLPKPFSLMQLRDAVSQRLPLAAAPADELAASSSG